MGLSFSVSALIILPMREIPFVCVCVCVCVCVGRRDPLPRYHYIH